MKSKPVFAVMLMAGALAFTSGSAWSQGMLEGQQQGQERETPGVMGERQPGTPDVAVERQPGQERGTPGVTAGVQLSSEEIKKAQQALKEKGHDPGEIDGQMSAQTTAAIRAFQQSQGLQATGELDPQTLKSLGVEKDETAPHEAAPGAAPGVEPRGGAERGGGTPGSGTAY